MEQTQQLDWDESALGSDSTEGSQEPVGKLHVCSGVHGPEQDFWIHVGDNIIGRLESCEVTLPVQSVSKKHAVIEAEADCHTIYDCGSLNKTRRCKTVLKPQVRYALADGDLLLFADVACQYFILSHTGREEGVLSQTTEAQKKIGPLKACTETATVETTQDFNSDDDSVLVPATQTNAVKSLVFEKTPAARKMGYGGVLAKDSDDDEDGEGNARLPRGSKGSKDSTSSREGGDLCTSATINTPNGATVIPESDDECPETSVVSAPSMHLHYDSDTEADESLIKPDNASKLYSCGSASTLVTKQSLKVVDQIGKAKVSVVGTNVDKGSVAEAQHSGITEQKSALYHLDSDTDVEDEEVQEVLTKNGAKDQPAPFHVHSDTDFEEEQKPSAVNTGRDFDENSDLVNGAAALPDLRTAHFHLDSDTDVEEDGDVLTKLKPGLPDIDLASDTDVEENINVPFSIGVHDRCENDNVEVVSSTKALARGSRVDSARDSNTDLEDEPMSKWIAKEQGGLKLGDAQDSDTDVEDEVGTSRKYLRKRRANAEFNGSARKVRDTSKAVPIQDQDDDDTDIEDANEKPNSDTEGDESDIEEEATQAFAFKSPPVQLMPFKKPPVPSPRASALSLPVCTSSEKEEYSDDENLAVAETQSFCGGPDLSEICVEDEPTQAFFPDGSIELGCPSISKKKDIDSATDQVNAYIPGRNSLRENMEIETVAEEETQLFCAHSTPVTPNVQQCQEPSQDETQPIELYLGLQAGRVESSEALIDRQSVMDQVTKAECSSLDSEVKRTSAVKNFTPSFFSTAKTGASNSSPVSLLESQESQKQSIDTAQSEESTQPLSLRLSEEPTQSYTIDLSKEPKESEAFDTEPVLPLFNLGNGPETEFSEVVVKEGFKQDGVSMQAFESATAGQFMQDSETPTTLAISPDKAFELVPGPSDMVKLIAPEEVSAAELCNRKKLPGLTKRGKKKKPFVVEEKEMVVPAAEPVNVLAPPAKETTTHLPDTEIEVKEKLPQVRGRQTRRTANKSSSLDENRNADIEIIKEQNTEKSKMVDLKEGRKVRQGRGMRRDVAPQVSQCVTEAEADLMVEPSNIPSGAFIDAAAIPQSLVQDVESIAPIDQPTVDVDAQTTTYLSTPSDEVSPTKAPRIVHMDTVTSIHTYIKGMEAKVSGPHIDDIENASTEFLTANVEAVLCAAPAPVQPSTSGDDGTQIATTSTAERRNEKRGKGSVKVAMMPVEPEQRGYRNQKILATASPDLEIMEEPKAESAPTRGRGRSKKAASTNLSEQQLEIEVTAVEPATLTTKSHTMKMPSITGIEEELRLAPSRSGRLRRVVPGQKEDVDDKKDHPLVSGRRKSTKKPLTVEIREAPEVEPPPKMCREEDAITGSVDEQPHKTKQDSHLMTSRHVKETYPSEQLSFGGEQMISDQSDAFTPKHVLIANPAAVIMVKKALTNDLTLNHAAFSKAKESSSTEGKYSTSKQETLDKSEDITSHTIDTLAIVERDEMEAHEEMAKAPSNMRGNRKRETRKAKNTETAVETTASVADHSAFMKREIVKTSAEIAEKVETPVSAPCASKKKETVEAAVKTVIQTPQNSRVRNIDTDKEVTEEPAMTARASRRRVIVKTNEDSVKEVVQARTSRRRGTIDFDKVFVQETKNHNLRTGSEQKEQTCAADEERKVEKGLENTAEATEYLGSKQAEKEGTDKSNAEKNGNLEQEQQAADPAIDDLATIETVSSPKEVGGQRRQQDVKKEINSSKVEQGGLSKRKKKRESAVSAEDIVATESDATTSNLHSEGSIERIAGRHKKQQVAADKLGKDAINQLNATEQESRRNGSLLNEEPIDSFSTKGMEDSLSDRSQGNMVPKDGKKRKEKGKPLEKLEVEGQTNAMPLEGLQVRGRAIQRRKLRKVEEASTAEDLQSASLQATKDIHDKTSSRSTSRSHSNGRSKTDSPQESLAPGRIRRKQSSAASEGKAEDTNIPLEAETPRRKGRGPNVSNSPGFFGDPGSPKIMFTGVIDENGEQVVQRLGGELADSVYECTHLVTDRIRRTVKFLCAVARGIPIVTLDWLEKCGKNKCFLSPSSFLVKDREQELNFNFRLSESLQKARKQRLLEGYEIHVTSSVKPEPEHMKDIIQCSGATFLSKMPREYKDKRVIISCSADLAKCKPALSASLPVANAELILTGILQQLIDLNAFRLEGTATDEGGDKLRGGKRASSTSSTLPASTGASKRRR